MVVDPVNGLLQGLIRHVGEIRPPSGRTTGSSVPASRCCPFARAAGMTVVDLRPLLSRVKEAVLHM